MLLPLLPNEVLGNEANLHWIFLWLAPWLLLANPRTRWGGIRELTSPSAWRSSNRS